MGFYKSKRPIRKILLQESDIFHKNKFFPDTKLSYAENMLKKNDLSTAIIFKSENGYRSVVNWKNLNLNVEKISNWMLSSMELKKEIE